MDETAIQPTPTPAAADQTAIQTTPDKNGAAASPDVSLKGRADAPLPPVVRTAIANRPADKKK